jgi:hypothetical protein
MSPLPGLRDWDIESVWHNAFDLPLRSPERNTRAPEERNVYSNASPKERRAPEERHSTTGVDDPRNVVKPIERSGTRMNVRRCRPCVVLCRPSRGSDFLAALFAINMSPLPGLRDLEIESVWHNIDLISKDKCIYRKRFVSVCDQLHGVGAGTSEVRDLDDDLVF